MRLIDADALIEFNTLCKTIDEEWAVKLSTVDSAPTIDPARRGKWIIEERNDLIYIYCSECKRFGVETPYCPNCGAKMNHGDTK